MTSNLYPGKKDEAIWPSGREPLGSRRLSGAPLNDEARRTTSRAPTPNCPFSLAGFRPAEQGRITPLIHAY